MSKTEWATETIIRHWVYQQEQHVPHPGNKPQPAPKLSVSGAVPADAPRQPQDFRGLVF